MPDFSQAEFEAQMDLDALKRIESMDSDPRRASNVQTFLKKQMDTANQAMEKFGAEKRPFNNAVRGSKMNAKSL